MLKELTEAGISPVGLNLIIAYRFIPENDRTVVLFVYEHLIVEGSIDKLQSSWVAYARFIQYLVRLISFCHMFSF